MAKAKTVPMPSLTSIVGVLKTIESLGFKVMMNNNAVSFEKQEKLDANRTSIIRDVLSHIPDDWPLEQILYKPDGKYVHKKKEGRTVTEYVYTHTIVSLRFQWR